jgi:hypothetical protein
VIGSSMLRMLQLVLGDRLTFTERAEGLARQVAQVADRFRWSLNCLADGWAARGRAREYAVVALPMPVEPNCWQPVMPTGMPERYRNAGPTTIQVMQEISIPAVLLLGGSSLPHEPRHQLDGAFVQHAFVVVVFVHVTLVRAPAHPLRLRRQVPIVWVAFYGQPRFDLALAAPRPIILSLELGGIGYLPPPVVAATKPARARRLPKHGNEAPGDGTREVPLPAAEMAGLRYKDDALIERPELNAKPPLVIALHVCTDETRRKRLACVAVSPSNPDRPGFCAGPDEASSGEPIDVELKSVFQTDTFTRSGHVAHPIKKGRPAGRERHGRNRRESDIPSNRLLGGHAQPMSCPVCISSPVRAVKALNTRWGTRLPLAAQFIGICFRQLARACGADQPFSYHRGSPQNQRQFRSLSLPAAYQQRSIGLFPLLGQWLVACGHMPATHVKSDLTHSSPPEELPIGRPWPDCARGCSGRWADRCIEREDAMTDLSGEHSWTRRKASVRLGGILADVLTAAGPALLGTALSP